jgi:hypothetical protein
MASKTDFTDDEWTRLQKGVTGAGLLVSLSDPGLFDSFKEAGALGSVLQQGRQNSPSQLVKELAETTRGTGFGLGTSPQDLETQTLDDLRASIGILANKAPDEVSSYSAFVLQVAQAVAASVSGVSTKESAAIDKIKSALGA